MYGVKKKADHALGACGRKVARRLNTFGADYSDHCLKHYHHVVEHNAPTWIVSAELCVLHIDCLLREPVLFGFMSLESSGKSRTQECFCSDAPREPAFVFFGICRAGAHHRHLPRQNEEELGKLIEVYLAQDESGKGHIAPILLEFFRVYRSVTACVRKRRIFKRPELVEGKGFSLRDAGFCIE